MESGSEDPEDRNPGSYSTLPETRTPTLDRRFRTALYIILGLLVILGLSGFLGVRTVTSEASANGFRLEVDHASVTRAGLATPLTFRLSTIDGSPLPETVDLAVDSSYLALFDENGIQPNPVDSWNDGETVVWSFHAPQGQDRLEIVLDARLEPGVQWGRTGRVALLGDDGERLEVHFRTWVMP